MNKKIINHFKKVDPVLYSIIECIDPLEEIKPKKPKEYFYSLCREIINQQLADKAAHAIFNRFLNLFPKQNIEPSLVIKLTEQNLRDVGMSWAKARYIKDLASKVHNKEVKLEKLQKMNNQEAINELVKIKGVGLWTAEMFLMFSLGKEDIFSFGDLGLRRAIEKLYKIENLAKDQAGKITAKWSPYRTFACRILWSSLDI